MSGTRIKQMRLDLLNQLPLVLRSSALVRQHAELVCGIESMAELEFRSKVDALILENAMAMAMEQTRLVVHYADACEMLVHLAPPPPPPPAPAHAGNAQPSGRPQRYIEFEDFCAHLQLRKETEGRVLMALQQGDEPSLRETMTKIKNIIGTCKLAEFAQLLDPNYQNVLRYPSSTHWERQTAEVLLGLQR